MLRVFETIATYDRDIKAGFSIELAPITVLTGENMTGKSLVLHCIYNRAGKLIGRARRLYPLCTAESRMDIDIAVFVDAYRAVDLLRLFRKKDDVFLTPHYKLLKTLAKYASSKLLDEAFETLQDVADRFKEVSKKRGVELDLPMVMRKYGKAWVDLKTGAIAGFADLSFIYAPSVVMMYVLYAYAASRGNSVYLLVEQPEAHASPVTAFFLGRLMKVLVKRAAEKKLKFRIAATTYSLDFILGAYGEDIATVYIFKRHRDSIAVERWDGKSYIPALSAPPVYNLEIP